MDCIFCKIIAGQLDSAKIWPNKEFTALLDINPNVTGVTLVVSNAHFCSDLHDMSADEYSRFFLAAREVSEILKKALDVKRVAMVVEGMGINHAHIKLYPLHGLQETFQEMWAKERVFFDKYEGYVTTQLGPKAEMSDLKKLAESVSKFAIKK